MHSETASRLSGLIPVSHSPPLPEAGQVLVDAAPRPSTSISAHLNNRMNDSDDAPRLSLTSDDSESESEEELPSEEDDDRLQILQTSGC